jgi:hypothetical protein
MPTTYGGDNITFPDASTQNTSPKTGFVNRIINGEMDIDQRNAGAAVTITSTVANTYTLDRWAGFGLQASKFSIQQSTVAPAGFVNSLLATSLTAYSVLTGDIFRVSQVIEGLNVSDLAWGTANAQPVTISFWVRSSLTGTFSGSLLNSATDRSYVFSYTISAANTYEYKTVTIPGDTSGTWLTTNGIGIRLGFNLGSGATYSTTAGAWSAGAFTAATGSVSVVGTNGATFYITGVQLEKGSTATPFEFRSIGTELGLAQRYYQKLGNVSYAGIGSGFQQSTSIAMFVAKQNVVMRASPSLGFSQLIVTDRTGFDSNVLTISSVATSPDSIYVQVTNDVAGSARWPVFLATRNTTTGYLELSSEL